MPLELSALPAAHEVAASGGARPASGSGSESGAGASCGSDSRLFCTGFYAHTARPRVQSALETYAIQYTFRMVSQSVGCTSPRRSEASAQELIVRVSYSRQFIRAVLCACASARVAKRTRREKAREETGLVVSFYRRRYTQANTFKCQNKEEALLEGRILQSYSYS